MKEVQEGLAQRPIAGGKSYQDLFQEILTDADVAQFVSEKGLSQDQITRSLSKFYEYINERNKYQTQDQAYIAKGYRPILIMNAGYADVSYEETPELKAAQQKEAIRKRLRLVGLPASLKEATLAPHTANSVYLTKARAGVLSYLSQFIKQVGSPNNKGLYVYGDFGVGKSFLLAALAHDLSETYQLETTLVHYPTFVVAVKQAISSGSVQEEIDQLKDAAILVLDDIGAEQHSSWVRDDVLQVILQHRMQEQLPTFFTSNFSFSDLERHFSTGKSGEEVWQAKRVMERIRCLATEMHLEGENQRHE